MSTTSPPQKTKKLPYRQFQVERPAASSSLANLSATHLSVLAMIADLESSTQSRQSTCLERAGDSVDRSIYEFFYRIGHFCCNRPKTTIGIALAISIACAAGMAKLTPENRPEKLWVPQGTQAGIEEEVRLVIRMCEIFVIVCFFSRITTPSFESQQFFEYFPANSRFQNVIISSGENEGSRNVLTKDQVVNVMKLHESIENGVSTYNGTSYTFTDLCTVAGGCVQNIILYLSKRVLELTTNYDPLLQNMRIIRREQSNLQLPRHFSIKNVEL